MPLPVIAGTVRITYRGAMPSGTQWANVLHARYAGGASTPGASDITALDAILRRVYTGTAYSGGAAWLTACLPTVQLFDATAYKLDGSSPPQLININAVGGGTGSLLPPEVAHVVTLRTATRGRSFRGRVYLPAVRTANVDANGLLSSAVITSTLAQWNGVIAALGGPSIAPFWELGVASYKHQVFTPLASVTMDAKPDVQRRRKR